MRLVDCFLYNNEDLILEIRLNTLNEYVDNFVIVESKFDHQGNKKKLNFNLSNYKKFEHKIKYLVIDKFPENMSSWDRENYQRNYINKGIQEFNKDDYIMISDVDEIPNLKEINNLDKYKFTVFKQKLFYYKFNTHNTTTPFWFGSKICKKKYLKSPQWLRNQKVKKNSFWKFYKIKWNIIQDGGWHFSFLMDAHQIEAKLNSFAHEEYNNDYFKNFERINHSIDNNIDLLNRGFNYKKIDFDESFPKYILDNKKKFKKWIL